MFLLPSSSTLPSLFCLLIQSSFLSASPRSSSHPLSLPLSLSHTFYPFLHSVSTIYSTIFLFFIHLCTLCPSRSSPLLTTAYNTHPLAPPRPRRSSTPHKDRRASERDRETIVNSLYSGDSYSYRAVTELHTQLRTHRVHNRQLLDSSSCTAQQYSTSNKSNNNV